MGGPACGMWIPAATNQRMIVVVDRMIRTLDRPKLPSTVHLRNDPRGRRRRRQLLREQEMEQLPRSHRFDLHDTRPFGGRYYELWQPMYCSPPYECVPEIRDEVEDLAVCEAFDLAPPLTTWSVGTFVNCDDSHRALAEIVAYLLEQVGGVVDFGARLSDDFIADLPGHIELIRGGQFSCAKHHFLDAVAMRAWSKLPKCWMSK